MISRAMELVYFYALSIAMFLIVTHWSTTSELSRFSQRFEPREIGSVSETSKWDKYYSKPVIGKFFIMITFLRRNYNYKFMTVYKFRHYDNVSVQDNESLALMYS